MSTEQGFKLTDEPSKLDQLKEMLDLNDWLLIVKALHYSHTDKGLIPDDVQWRAYCKADGFGNMTSAQLKEINGGWDWSHIRDSSDDAHHTMAAYLRTKIRDLIAAERTSESVEPMEDAEQEKLMVEKTREELGHCEHGYTLPHLFCPDCK